MEEEVIAAFVAAGAAILAAGANAFITHSTAQQRRDAEMTLTALQHFEGHSQPRSVGIAALTVLRGNRKVWMRSRDMVAQLFYRQLLYLYSHGKNRWQAHEISNMEAMTEWLLSDMDILPAPTQSMRKALRQAMSRYKEDWVSLPEGAREKARDNPVEPLLACMDRWRKSDRLKFEEDGSSEPPA